MDYDKIVSKYCREITDTDAYKIALQNKNFLKDALKEISKWKKNLIKEQNNIYNNKEVTAEDIFDVINDENETRLEKGDTPLEPLREFSKSEQKRRKNLSKKALKIASEGAGRYFAKSVAYDLDVKKTVGRSTAAAVISLCKDENEVLKITNKLNHIDEGNNRKEVRDFMIAGIEKGKKCLDDLTEIKSDEELIDFMSKNFDLFQFFSEMQGTNMEQMNDELKLDISKDYIDDWRENYSHIAVDALTCRSKLFVMANPLYSQIDPDDVGKLQDYEFKYYNNKYVDVKDNNEIGKWYVNPINDYNYHVQIIQSSNYLKNVSENDYQKVALQSGFLKDSIKYKLYKSSFDTDINKYQFFNSNGKEVESEKALKDIAHGETYSLMKDNKFVMKLENQKGIPTGILGGTNKKTYFNLKDAFNKNKTNDDKLINDLARVKEEMEAAKNSLGGTLYSNELAALNKKYGNLKKSKNALENKINDAKVTNIKNADKKLNASLKELYSKVKSHNPWYIRRNGGNKTYTNVQNGLDEIMNGKHSFKEKQELIKNVRDQAQSYLTSRAQNPNRSMNKHALEREEAMLQVLESLYPIEKEYNEVEAEFKKFDDVVKSENKELIENLDNELSKDEITNSKYEKGKDFDNELLNEFIEEDEEDLVNEI